MLRTAAIFVSVLVSLATLGAAQTSVEQVDTRPKATVVVKEDPTGSELVNVTYADPKFPSELALQQIQALGKELGVPARGVQLFHQRFGDKPDQRWLKAQFAINGLIDRSGGTLSLQPLARAFAGASEPFTVNAIKVIFDGERPNEKSIRTFANDSVGVDGQFVTSPPSLEYTILLRTQDPGAISIPAQHSPPVAPTPPPAAAPGPPMNFLIGLIVIGSAAAGALVYFLLSGSGSRRR